MSKAATARATKRWREANRERHNATIRRSKIKTQYGMTVEEYDAAVAGPCAICGKQARVMDHNHQTGARRRALCQNCNLGLGHFKDSPELLHRAGEYLSGHAVP
jgi:hypothetical protein